MAQGFYARLIRTAAYRDIIGARGLSAREAALLNLASAISAKDENELRVTIARLEEELKREQLKTQFAVWISHGGAAVRQGLLFLITPYTEMGQRPLLEGPVENPFIADDEDTADEDAEGATKPNKAATGSAQKVLASMPKWMHVPIQMLASRISKLSPLTTAILFALVVAGSIAFANYQYGSIEKSYKLAMSDVEALKGIKTQYEAATKELESAQTSKQELERNLAAANDRIASQKDAIRERDEAIVALKTEHKGELDALRQNVDAATKDALARQDQLIEALQTENTGLNAQVSDLNGRLQAALTRSDTEPLLKQQIGSLKENLDAKERRLAELQTVESELNSLVAFTTDLLTSVKRNLLENDVEFVSRFRDKFREEYRIIYQRKETFFEEIGLQKF